MPDDATDASVLIPPGLGARGPTPGATSSRPRIKKSDNAISQNLRSSAPRNGDAQSEAAASQVAIIGRPGDEPGLRLFSEGMSSIAPRIPAAASPAKAGVANTSSVLESRRNGAPANPLRHLEGRHPHRLRRHGLGAAAAFPQSPARR